MAWLTCATDTTELPRSTWPPAFPESSGRVPLTGGGLAGSGPGFGWLPGSEEVLILGGTPEARLPPSW